MPLVILTYPGHFLLTVLTIKSYIKHHSMPQKVYIVVDDLSDKAWPTYCKDCQDLYSKYVPEVSVVPASLIQEAHKFASGWVRQQIIKLHLDTVIDETEWFFTDGDIVFLHGVDPDDIPYSVPNFGRQTQLQNEYVQWLLGIDHPGLHRNGQQVCVSNPAFRTMHRLVLEQLRRHIEAQHHTTLALLHNKYECSDSIEVSEWELIENFKAHVLGQDLKLTQYAPYDIHTPIQELNFFTHQFLTCYAMDQDLGREWFEQQDIRVSNDQWNRLSEIRR